MKPFLSLFALAVSSPLAVAADVVRVNDSLIDAAFGRADADKNGTVSLAEAKRFGISEQVFTKANPDKDGSLDKREFATAIAAQFAAANPDKDGTLDWTEARKAGIKTRQIFDAADPDKDGTLDLAEHLSALTAQAE